MMSLMNRTQKKSNPGTSICRQQNQTTTKRQQINTHCVIFLMLIAAIPSLQNNFSHIIINVNKYKLFII